MPALYVQWIQNLEKDNKLTVIKLTDGDYLRTLENAVQVPVKLLEYGTHATVWGAPDRFSRLLIVAISTTVSTVQF